MFKRLGQILRQKREQAGLSLPQLSALTALPVNLLLELEQGLSESVSLELCEQLGKAMAAVTGERYVMQDLWLAYSVDHHLRSAQAGG